MECGQCALSGQFDQTSLVNVYHHDHYQYLVKNAVSDKKKSKDTVKEKQTKNKNKKNKRKTPEKIGPFH